MNIKKIINEPWSYPPLTISRPSLTPLTCCKFISIYAVYQRLGSGCSCYWCYPIISTQPNNWTKKQLTFQTVVVYLIECSEQCHISSTYASYYVVWVTEAFSWNRAFSRSQLTGIPWPVKTIFKAGQTSCLSSQIWCKNVHFEGCIDEKFHSGST